MMTLVFDGQAGGVDPRGSDQRLEVSRGAGTGDPLIRGITFGSCYVYSPWGSDCTAERSRLLRALLKAGDERFIVKYACRVREQAATPRQVTAASPLAGFFGADPVLIPIPGSELAGGGALSVADHVAAALHREGLGRCVWPALHRVRAVRKSATALPGTRPSVADHYDSFAVDAAFPQGQIMLIDDVVTKGRTLLAAAARLQEAFPGADVRAFAMLRTMGLGQGVARLLEPCVGAIKWRAGDARRSP